MGTAAFAEAKYSDGAYKFKDQQGWEKELQRDLRTFLKARGLYQGVSVGSSRARISERHLASPAGEWLGSFSAPPTRVVKNVFQDFSLPEVRTQLVY